MPHCLFLFPVDQPPASSHLQQRTPFVVFRAFLNFCYETFVATLRQSLAFGSTSIHSVATELSGPKMDPAETERMRQALSNQGTLVGQHETALRQVLEHLRELTTSVTQLNRRMDSLTDLLTPSTPSAEPPPPPQPPEPYIPYIPIPARYSGDLGTCAQFLHQCLLVYNQQAVTYSTHQSKVASLPPLSPSTLPEVGQARLAPAD